MKRPSSKSIMTTDTHQTAPTQYVQVGRDGGSALLPRGQQSIREDRRDGAAKPGSKPRRRLRSFLRTDPKERHMKLYHSSSSPNSRRVRILIAEKALEIE